MESIRTGGRGALPEEKAPSVPAARIDELRVSAYTIPTATPESDGTLQWDATTLVLVEAGAGGVRGLGYTYADRATATLIHDRLVDLVVGRDALAVTGAWQAMVGSCRNLGRPGIVSMAISAVDTALWDLKARLLGVPLALLFGGPVRRSVPVYGSGGFTSYSPGRLQEQLAGWAGEGMGMVKMKIGREPRADRERMRVVRAAIGEAVELFIDANGAFTPVHAAAVAAEAAADAGVRWFEEPVSSDDLAGLRAVRARAPAGMEIAAGEYGYDLFYFRRMLEAGAVDVLQADVTRCAGMTEFLRVGALCDAWHVPLSAHTAPALHLHLGCALPAMRHLEYFYDHVRIEEMFFDGVAVLRNGMLAPDLSRPGMGLEFKRADAARYALS